MFLQPEVSYACQNYIQFLLDGQMVKKGRMDDEKGIKKFEKMDE